ncbi:MAG: hypothetical protein R3C05_08600 [Pirellulaceae bacterium]
MPGLIEGRVYVRGSAHESLSELSPADLIVRDFHAHAETPAKLALPIEELSGLLEFRDVGVDLTKSDGQISAHLRGVADVLGAQHSLIGDVQLIDGGFAGLLILDRQQSPNPWRSRAASWMPPDRQVNTTGRPVELSEIPRSQELIDLLEANGIAEFRIAEGANVHAIGELAFTNFIVDGRFDLVTRTLETEIY